MNSCDLWLNLIFGFRRGAAAPGNLRFDLIPVGRVFSCGLGFLRLSEFRQAGACPTGLI